MGKENSDGEYVETYEEWVQQGFDGELEPFYGFDEELEPFYGFEEAPEPFYGFER